MNTSVNTFIIEKLQEIVKDQPNTLKASVTQEILEYNLGNIQEFFQDFYEVAPICHLIGKYNYDEYTHEFYDRHYYEIELLRKQNSTYFSRAVQLDYDLKTLFCWFAFEHTVNELVTELKLEI